MIRQPRELSSEPFYRSHFLLLKTEFFEFVQSREAFKAVQLFLEAQLAQDVLRKVRLGREARRVFLQEFLP